MPMPGATGAGVIPTDWVVVGGTTCGPRVLEEGKDGYELVDLYPTNNSTRLIETMGTNEPRKFLARRRRPPFPLFNPLSFLPLDLAPSNDPSPPLHTRTLHRTRRRPKLTRRYPNLPIRKPRSFMQVGCFDNRCRAGVAGRDHGDVGERDGLDEGGAEAAGSVRVFPRSC